MSVKLKSITEGSWLVLGDTDEIKIGLLTKVKEEYILMSKGEKKKFLDKKEVSKFFQEDVFKNIVTAEEEPVEKTYFIKGFPVAFDNPHEVTSVSTKLPLFSKKPSSDVYYCAGYYCLHFPKNWVPTFCPKLSTLETYDYLGPFATEIEMKAHLSKARKERLSK